MGRDLVIRGGWVVDGTGSDRFQADVAVANGRVVAVEPGTEVGVGTRVIEADGLVVSPGFVDVHTHYDAQLTWDPAATPSISTVVTTVLGGNCGFSLAPVTPEAAEYLVPDAGCGRGHVRGIAACGVEAGLAELR